MCVALELALPSGPLELGRGLQHCSPVYVCVCLCLCLCVCVSSFPDRRCTSVRSVSCFNNFLINH